MLHEDHQTSSTTSSRICTMLSQSLANMKFSESRNLLEGLDKFDSNLQKFNRISPNDKMTNNIATMYLRSATHTNKDLLAAWVQCEAMHEMTGKPTPTYEEFYAFMLKSPRRWKMLLLMMLRLGKLIVQRLNTYLRT